jgi:hypothetical protein
MKISAVILILACAAVVSVSGRAISNSVFKVDLMGWFESILEQLNKPDNSNGIDLGAIVPPLIISKRDLTDAELRGWFDNLLDTILKPIEVFEPLITEILSIEKRDLIKAKLRRIIFEHLNKANNRPDTPS